MLKSNLLQKSLFILMALFFSSCFAQTEDKMDKQIKSTEGLEKATFGGGCFWCMEPPFDAQEGVFSTTAGYMGGHLKNPTYEEVCTGNTGHAEVIQVLFDPKKVSYEKLLDIFWRNIDPTTKNRQFADRGSQYRTVIFYHSPEQKKRAEKSKQELSESGKFDSPIVTEIVEASDFYPAEDYHQEYYRKNTMHYKMYRRGSGRESYLEETWGKKD